MILLTLLTFFCSASIIARQISFYDLEPSEKDLVVGMSMGRGLYYNSHDIVNLNSTNFHGAIGRPGVSWLVEFYSSSCGRCQKFAPIYRRLAGDVSHWKSVLRIAALDCFNEINIPVCRDYDEYSLPTIMYFSPSNGYHYSIKMDQIRDSDEVDYLREAVAKELTDRPDMSRLRPFLDSLSDVRKRTPLQHVVLVTECKPLVGPQLILDYWSNLNVTIISADCNSRAVKEIHIEKNTISGIYILNKNGTATALAIEDFTRTSCLTALHTYFDELGIQVPQPFNLSSVLNHTVAISNIADVWLSAGKGYSGKLRRTNVLFIEDIERAVRQTFELEISLRDRINGSAYKALRNYLLVLKKYFPMEEDGRRFIQCIMDKTIEVSASGVTGEDFAVSVTTCREANPSILSGPGWIGCKGSLPFFRGFPCAMWTMFHTLTVRSYKNGGDPKEVLRAMKGYMKHFFGCTACANHFAKAAASMEEEVGNHEDSILWLWSVHNEANRRLSGDVTEDPSSPKVQFPPPTLCPKCHLSNSTFDRKEVLSFLVSMYSKTNRVSPRSLHPPTRSTMNSFSRNTSCSGSHYPFLIFTLIFQLLVPFNKVIIL